MGNPEVGSSAYQQPQQYDTQPQEYQYEAAIHDEFSAPTNEPSQLQPQPNDLQASLPPPGFQQQQPSQFPPSEGNQAFGAQPSAGPDRPATYPPQGRQMAPAQPVNFPPPSPQNTEYSNGSNQPSGYRLQGPQPMPTQAVNFPPQPMPSQATPMFYPQTTAQYPPTVGYQAPPAMQFQNNGPQAQYGIPLQSPGLKPIHGNIGWSSGLFDCMNDPMNALVTACFPCLTFGQLAEIVDEGHTTCGTSGAIYCGIAFCIAIPCILSCTYRTKLRNKFNLPEAPAPDWATHFLCEWCALCQEYRELQSRGYDPSIGWQGNVARNQNMQLQQATMMAPMNQTMMG